MKRGRFLLEYESYKVICNGNAPEICSRYDIEYSDYRKAINGKETCETKLEQIMNAIRSFVEEATAIAISSLQREQQAA